MRYFYQKISKFSKCLGSSKDP